MGEVIVQPNQVTDVMRRAFHALRNGPPGPVIVEIPADIGGQEVPEGTPSYQPPRRLLQRPSVNDIKDAVRLLLSAKKPVIWSGMGVLFSDATEELKDLAELSQIPVLLHHARKSSFDERHPSLWVQAVEQLPYLPGDGYKSLTSSLPSVQA